MDKQEIQKLVEEAIRLLMGEELSKLNERQIKIWEYLVEHKTITAKECEGLFKDVSRKTIN